MDSSPKGLMRTEPREAGRWRAVGGSSLTWASKKGTLAFASFHKLETLEPQAQMEKRRHAGAHGGEGSPPPFTTGYREQVPHV